MLSGDMQADADDAATPGWTGAPRPTRPGTVKPQLAAQTLRLYAGDWGSFQA